MLTRRRFKILLFALCLLLISSLAIGGYEKAKADKSRSRDGLYDQVELMADAISILRNEYADEIDSKKLIYGAMKGMLSSLDEFSQFMEPDEYEDIKVEASGEFGGIGVEISSRDGVVTVVTPIIGTPAEAAGVKPGDKIVKINGKITKDVSMNDAVKQMRGSPGTMVTLTIWREKDEKILDVPIKRAMIKIRSIKKALLIEDKIGYIRLVEFQENTARDLENELKKLESRGIDSLILDLRYNPGGLLDGAVDVSEKFLEKDKVIVSIKSRNPDENAVLKSSGKITHPDYPIIVLVNEGSASASEIVAGAIKDNKRGVVLGEKTYGKASVQMVVPLKDGSALKFTTASYLTPSGRPIKGQGVMPDVIVEEKSRNEKKTDAEDIFDKVDKAKDAVDQPSDGYEAGRDAQLDAAVNLMKAIKIYRGEKK